MRRGDDAGTGAVRGGNGEPEEPGIRALPAFGVSREVPPVEFVTGGGNGRESAGRPAGTSRAARTFICWPAPSIPSKAPVVQRNRTADRCRRRHTI